jgi:2-keto-3-deoxy-6-phosphogluconate aldolase
MARPVLNEMEVLVIGHAQCAHKTAVVIATRPITVGHGEDADMQRTGVAVAVGVGSALLDTKAIAAKQFDVIEANARRMVANVAAARSR